LVGSVVTSDEESHPTRITRASGQMIRENFDMIKNLGW
jgi:hypothetical protein